MTKGYIVEGGSKDERSDLKMKSTIIFIVHHISVWLGNDIKYNMEM